LAAKWPASHLAVLLAAGIGLPLVFARELIRPAPREHLVRSSTATATGVLAVATMGFWVEAAALPHLLDLTAIASCAIAGSCIALSLGQFLSSWRWRREASAVVGVLLAALAGAGLSFLVAVPWAAGAAVAAACGVAPAALWLADSRRDLFDGVLCLRDAALLVLPLSVTSVPVWAAALMR
jgi:hypothetical protein